MIFNRILDTFFTKIDQNMVIRINFKVIVYPRINTQVNLNCMRRKSLEYSMISNSIQQEILGN